MAIMPIGGIMGIKETRKRIGVNQTQFADLIGSTQPKVSEVETGKIGWTKHLAATILILNTILDHRSGKAIIRKLLKQ